RRADLTALEVLARERGVAAEHDAAGLRQIDDERLMTWCVAWCRHDLETCRHTDAPRDGQVRELWDVPVHAREVRLALREDEVVALDDEGRLRERAVVARVIEMQMAVHDDGHLVRTNAQRREPRDDRVLLRHDDLETARAERRVGPLDVHWMKTGVEQHVAFRRSQQRGPHRDEGLVVGRARNERRRADLDPAGAEDGELDHSRSSSSTAVYGSIARSATRATAASRRDSPTRPSSSRRRASCRSASTS